MQPGPSPLEIGQMAFLKLRFGQRDFDRFAALSGDDNPIHVDPQFAAHSAFGSTVAHGMLLYSAICRVLGTELPGPGTLQLEQELMFPSPTYVGEEITVRVEVAGLPEPGLAVLGTTITRPRGETACEGRTLVCPPGSPLGVTLPPIPLAALPGEASTYKRLALGETASLTRTFSREDIAEYISLTGDTNPLYTDTACAFGRGLKDTPVPGGLLGGLFSCLLGTRLPGRGTNWLKQRLRFPARAYPGNEVTATVEIVRLRPEKDLANLRTTCTLANGQVVCEGEALVRVKDLE